MQRSADALAWLCLLGVIAATVYLCARPLDTGDVWWHLSLGEVFAEQGFSLDSDPLVHTALPDSPRAHEWLFQVALYAVNEVSGFSGLRALHAIWAAGLVAGVFALLRRRTGSAALAACGAIAFTLLAWYRLFQLRPDLVSVTGCLVLWVLVFDVGGRLRAPRIAAASAAMLVWANCHPVFGVGLALIIAALVGCGIEWGVRRQRGIEAVGDARPELRARDLALLFAACLALSAINPHGFAQHLHFFQVGGGAEAFAIGDEWVRFNPFAWGHYLTGSVSLPTFIVADALLLLFAGAAGVRARSLLRASEGEREAALRAFDPVGFALGLASIVAMCAAVRFLWLGVFPILYILAPSVRSGKSSTGRADGAASVELPFGAASSKLGLGAVAASVAMAIAYTQVSGFERDASAWARYNEPYEARGHPVRSARFLQQVSAEGKLFNSYASGGFLGYWLAPKLKVFIDSRLESPPEVYREYALVNRQHPAAEGEAFFHILERREVDFFIGSGLPTALPEGNSAQFTTLHLQGAPGWLLVFRSYDEAVYLRLNRRNLGNLKRIAQYYANERVPFEVDTGLDIGRVIREKQAWAVRHALLPSGYAQLHGMLKSGIREDQFLALDLLGASYLFAGDFEAALALDHRNHTHRPENKPALRRLVFDALQLGRPAHAREFAARLLAVDPEDARSKRFVDVAARYAQASQQLGAAAGGFQPALRRAIAALPIVATAEGERTIEGRYAAPERLLER